MALARKPAASTRRRAARSPAAFADDVAVAARDGADGHIEERARAHGCQQRREQRVDVDDAIARHEQAAVDVGAGQRGSTRHGFGRGERRRGEGRQGRGDAGQVREQRRFAEQEPTGLREQRHLGGQRLQEREPAVGECGDRRCLDESARDGGVAARGVEARDGLGLEHDHVEARGGQLTGGREAGELAPGRRPRRPCRQAPSRPGDSRTSAAWRG